MQRRVVELFKGGLFSMIWWEITTHYHAYQKHTRSPWITGTSIFRTHSGGPNGIHLKGVPLCALDKVKRLVEPPLISCSLTFCSLSGNQIQEGARVVARALQVNQSLQELEWVLHTSSGSFSVFIETVMYVLCALRTFCSDAPTIIYQGLITTQEVVLY